MDAQQIYAYPPATKWTLELLHRECNRAEEIIHIHGVSAYSEPKPGNPRVAELEEIRQFGWTIHRTPLKGQPDHLTIELPKPVTEETVTALNRVFGLL